jgi:hypothetical protein
MPAGIRNKGHQYSMGERELKDPLFGIAIQHR